MLIDVFQVEGMSLRAGKVSLSTFQAAMNVARRRDGGTLVEAASYQRSSAFAPPTPSGLSGQWCHWRPRTH